MASESLRDSLLLDGDGTILQDFIRAPTTRSPQTDLQTS